MSILEGARKPLFVICLTILLAVSVLTGCASPAEGESTAAPKDVVEEGAEGVEGAKGAEDTQTVYPLTISHAFGETIIEKKPERVATIAWGNHDVALALGVVPVGISKANYGVQDDSGMLPWTKEAFEAANVENPNLFNDITALDYEGIKASNPDIILAAYSGITEEEYALLSEIAPVVAYPTAAWQTFWRDQIRQNALGLGMRTEGEALVTSLETYIGEQTAGYPQLSGKSAAFFYFNPADLGKFYIYLPTDPRAAFLQDLGFTVPEKVTELAKTSTSFAIEISAENADLLEDIDVLVAYGDASLLTLLQKDALLGQVKGIKRGSVALIADNTPLAAAGTPNPLSIRATLSEYLEILGAAAELANE